MIKKFNLEGWNISYLEGEVTMDDVEVLEPETTECLPTELVSGYKSTKVVVRLKPEIRDMLSPNDNFTIFTTNTGKLSRFQSTIEAFTPCRSHSERAVKVMRTRHENDCMTILGEDNIRKESERLVRNANWEINDSRAKFISIVSSSMNNVESWDNKARLDELGTVRDQLKKKIDDIEDEMKRIMKGEIEEWLVKEKCNREIVNEILEKSRFRYIPDVLVIR